MEDYKFSNQNLKFISEKFPCSKIISYNEYGIFQLQARGFICFAEENGVSSIKRILLYFQGSKPPCLVLKVLNKYTY